MERLIRESLDAAGKSGLKRFEEVGCAECHRPALTTESLKLRFGFPEVKDDPAANLFYSLDLSGSPTSFETPAQGGLKIEIFSDLKRHDMGKDLAEDFHRATDERNREFITAALWGVADTAPYLHDGRALSIREAILWHGVEAKDARKKFEKLSEENQAEVIAILRSLRNPRSPNQDVIRAQ